MMTRLARSSRFTQRTGVALGALAFAALVPASAAAGGGGEEAVAELVAVKRVEASSTRAAEGEVKFDAAHLVDGRPETVWQPDARGASGLGQWVRLDFGREVAITGVEILTGAHGGEGAEDAWCDTARPVGLTAYGDSGQRLYFGPGGDPRRLTVSTPSGLDASPVTTRTLTLVIRGVERGMLGLDDVAISEVRVFGKPGAAAPPESGPVTCDSARLQVLRAAVIEACARRYQGSRPKAECTALFGQLDYCGEAAWLPIEAAEYAGPTLSLSIEDMEQPLPVSYAVTFARAGDRWTVESLTCRQSGEPCGLAQSLDPDSGSDPDRELRSPELCKTAKGRWLKRKKKR